MLLLAYRLRTDPGDAPDLHSLLGAVTADTTGPALELYTEGLFTDDRFLRAYESAPDPTAPTETGESR